MARGLYRDRLEDIFQGLTRYEEYEDELIGICRPEARRALAEQMISSLRRIAYIRSVQGRPISDKRVDPYSDVFDPIRAAALYRNWGKVPEAVWLTFLLTHFGKHAIDGWRLLSNVYGSFGAGPIWTFERYKAGTAQFEDWLQTKQAELSVAVLSGRFSNHRQYQSKKPEKIASTLRSFLEWMNEAGGFQALVQDAHRRVGQNPEATFDALYHSMIRVDGFGRLGRFDFLTMIGKLDIAPITPGSTYLRGATGPLAGAKLLLLGDRDRPSKVAEVEAKIDRLDEYLSVGKQVLEDSLCNWQKSPNAYVYFKG